MSVIYWATTVYELTLKAVGGFVDYISVREGVGTIFPSLMLSWAADYLGT